MPLSPLPSPGLQDAPSNRRGELRVIVPEATWTHFSSATGGDRTLAELYDPTFDPEGEDDECEVVRCILDSPTPEAEGEPWIACCRPAVSVGGLKWCKTHKVAGVGDTCWFGGCKTTPLPAYEGTFGAA
jgi:hypothetical protein